MENKFLKPQIEQLKDDLYRVREELKSEKNRYDQLSDIKSRQKEMRVMLKKISDESFLSVVKDYGIGFILVVAGIFMAFWNNEDKSKSEIFKAVFDENKEFFAKLNITDKEKFEQILKSMFSKNNK